MPLNQGVIDLIEFRAPRGCLVNPGVSRAVLCFHGRSGRSYQRDHAVALSKLLPGRVTAGRYATGNNLTAGGYDPARREDFRLVHLQSGGCGARATKDGNSAEWHLMANCKNESMEVWEQRYPVTISNDTNSSRTPAAPENGAAASV